MKLNAQQGFWNGSPVPMCDVLERRLAGFAASQNKTASSYVIEIATQLMTQ
jgi:hypothetical protein